MTKQIQVGNVITLTVERTADYGYFLTNGDESILLHHNDLDREVEIGEQIQVFIFNDKQGRPAASTVIPFKMLDDEYDWAEVIEVKQNMGAFVNVGLSKDILVSGDDLPKIEQLWPKAGDKLLITLKVDRLNRLFARLATESVILDYAYTTPIEMKNQNFSGYAYRVLRVGTFVFTDEGYRCFIHESERGSEEPRLGERVIGRVIGITSEGDMNGSLLPRGYERIDLDAQMVYEYLEKRNGAMPYTDRSAPAEIENRFQLSKAAFKRALGKLMKDGKVYQEEGWTYIRQKNEQ